MKALHLSNQYRVMQLQV